jgi:hypothetical protein
MKEYQKVMERVRKQKTEEYDKTIPEILQTVHPKILFDEMPDMLENSRYIQESLLE